MTDVSKEREGGREEGVVRRIDRGREGVREGVRE